MTDVMAWIQTYQREILVGAFFAVQGFFLIFLAITAHRITVVRRKIDEITGQVADYLKVVLAADAEGEADKQIPAIETKSEDEAENRLISAVLREIFP